MKVSTSSKKEPKSKVQKVEEKVWRLKASNSDLRRQNRLQRKRIDQLLRSRNTWKDKNKDKAAKNKDLQQRIRRRSKPKRHQFSVTMIQLCVLLRVSCGCSYRSICKILKVLELCFCLSLRRVPCANTIENWVSKMGLYGITNAASKVGDKAMCLIMDESLKLGNEKVLLMLLTPSNKETEGALKHTDVEVGYLGGKKSWTGENIKEQISELIDKEQIKLTHILSDQDSKLVKATRLLGVPHLPDISHAIGSCLRKIYKKSETYQGFIKLLGMYCAKSVNQDSTYLRPPNQRIKARFMNQKPILNWALTILKKESNLTEPEQLFYKELKEYKAVIKSLNKCIGLCEQIAKPLKEKGLSKSTLEEFKGNLEKARKDFKEDLLIITFIDLFSKYEHQYAEFYKGRKGQFNVSSDVIESLFGQHKNLGGTNKLIGVSFLDLELPVHCKTENEIIELSKTALEEIFTTDLIKWRTNHSSVNQAFKRNEFFKKRA